MSTTDQITICDIKRSQRQALRASSPEFSALWSILASFSSMFEFSPFIYFVLKSKHTYDRRSGIQCSEMRENHSCKVMGIFKSSGFIKSFKLQHKV